MTITAKRLSERMAEMRMSQSELALEIGCTQGAISQILLGRIQNSRLLPRIAARLGVPLPWLLGDSDESGVPVGELLADDERELLRNYRTSGKGGRRILLTMSREVRALITDDQG